MVSLPTRRNVVAAQRRLQSHIHRTPLISSRHLSALAGVEILFKCENLQKSGSFKYRGAMNAVLSLPPITRRCGVATHSSGNHGAALAAVAQQLGIAATIVVPRQGSLFKRQAIRRYGGRVVDCGATLKSREATLAKVLESTGATYIPPYDHPAIIAGQGTAALEVLDQVDRLDEIWLPVGGGGLAAGTIISVSAATDSPVQVVGAEPILASDAWQSMQRGTRVPAMAPKTVADGLRTALGELNFRILHGYGLPIGLVSEEEILAAQLLAMSCLKILLEPSSAVPLAALLKEGPHSRSTKRVVIVVTGGNVDPKNPRGIVLE